MSSNGRLDDRRAHPLVGTGLLHWLQLLACHGGIDAERLPQALSITAHSFCLAPFRALEHFRYGAQIERTRIESPPIFVIGHWRSGTTLLQNLLAQDPQFGYLNVVQSVFPTLFLSGESYFASRIKERQRRMDRIRVAGLSPSEEEVALALIAPGSLWHGYYFPKHLEYYFKRYVLFEEITELNHRRWVDAYHWLLKKLTLRHQGRPLVLKNPANTARVPTLLALFPGARFIHIYRNPYAVYLSRVAQYHNAVNAKRLQPLSASEWEGYTLSFYRRLMRRYFDDRALIPPGQLVEVRFEDLEKSPVDELARIYRDLRLPEFSNAEPLFNDYANKISDYRKNEYNLGAIAIDKVNSHWSFSFQALGYDQQ